MLFKYHPIHPKTHKLTITTCLAFIVISPLRRNNGGHKRKKQLSSVPSSSGPYENNIVGVEILPLCIISTLVPNNAERQSSADALRGALNKQNAENLAPRKAVGWHGSVGFLIQPLEISYFLKSTA